MSAHPARDLPRLLNGSGMAEVVDNPPMTPRLLRRLPLAGRAPGIAVGVLGAKPRLAVGLDRGMIGHDSSSWWVRARAMDGSGRQQKIGIGMRYRRGGL